MSKNPSVAGTSSTASNTSQTSEDSEEDANMSEDDTDSEFDFLTEIAEEAQVDPDVSICDQLTFESEFESKKQDFSTLNFHAKNLFFIHLFQCKMLTFAS